MKMIETCPLCGDIDVSIVERVVVSQLNDLYKANFKISGAISSPTLEYRHCNACDIRYFNPIKGGDEKFYERLQEYDWYYMSDKSEYEIAAKYISDDDDILEIGAGKAAFASIVGKSRYTGLEYNDKAILKAQSVGIELLKESVEDHAEKGVKYDVVVSFQVLEHVESPAEFIQSCVNCLKPEGKLIIAVPSHDGFNRNAINHVLDLPPHHLTHWSMLTLRKISEIFDLSLVSIEHEVISNYHTQWARKIHVETFIRKKIGIRSKLIDRSIAARVISKFSEIIARFINISIANTHGHTVIACYKKKSDE